MENTFGADVNKGPPQNKHKQNHYRNNQPLEHIEPLRNISNHYVTLTLRLCGFMSVKTPMENTFGVDVNKGLPPNKHQQTNVGTRNVRAHKTTM